MITAIEYALGVLKLKNLQLITLIFEITYAVILAVIIFLSYRIFCRLAKLKDKKVLMLRQTSQEDFILTSKICEIKNKVFLTVNYLFKRLINSPVLLGWVIIGTIIEFIRNSYKGIIVTIINLILLAVFTTIIKIMTEKSPQKPIKLKRPRLELFLGIIFLVFIFLEISIFWKQITIPYLSTYINNLSSSVESNIFRLGRLDTPLWVLNAFTNAGISVAMMLIPIIVLFLICGYGFKRMGFVFNNFYLILVLLGITIVLGLPFKILFKNSFYKTILTFFIMMFINGLPEELIYRGYILPRLEFVLKNSINALVIVAILFNMTHIPSELARSLNIYQAILNSFNIAYPSGLIWGYLYLKTRSVVPGVIWHTSNTILGIIFIGIS